MHSVLFKGLIVCDVQGCFSETTISALVSAVQKLACIEKIAEGMELYRGLGGSVDLPESYFKSDKYGTKGFVEWG